MEEVSAIPCKEGDISLEICSETSMGDFLNLRDNEWQGIATSAIGPSVDGPIKLEISSSEMSNSEIES